jgi:hypothetical protein
MPSSVSSESRRRLRGSARLRPRVRAARGRPERPAAARSRPSAFRRAESFAKRDTRRPVSGRERQPPNGDFAGRCKESQCARRCELPSACRCKGFYRVLVRRDACRCKGTSSVQRRERLLAIPDNFSHRSLRSFCNDVGRLRAIRRNLERRTTACGSHSVRVEWPS